MSYNLFSAVIFIGIGIIVGIIVCFPFRKLIDYVFVIRQRELRSMRERYDAAIAHMDTYASSAVDKATAEITADARGIIEKARTLVEQSDATCQYACGHAPVDLYVLANLPLFMCETHAKMSSAVRFSDAMEVS